MDDAVQTLLQKRNSREGTQEAFSGISFITTTMEVTNRTVKSLESINLIGDELGREYEIIMACPRQHGVSDTILRSMRKEFHNLMVIRIDRESYGKGKDTAFRSSTGKFIVPFHSNLVYPVEYADILHSFLEFSLKRLYFSELSLVHRDLINEVGGWRHLSNGEDVDLFSRLAVNFGILACPTNLMWKDNITIKEILGMRYSSQSSGGPDGQNLAMIRDLIIACNLSLREILDLSRIRKSLEGTGGRFLMFMAYMASRLSSIKPVTYNRNNLVVVMESVLESLILREYLKIPEMEDRVFLQIDRTHIEFLTEHSKMFRDMKASLAYFLRDQI
ncbi:MAG: hypothetical protein M1302_02040 [Candidatus Thermoplasmatota archaeon]|nr:hypothetical protein [Candidatus Thermoplasmatota archaeon]